jgi:anti-anti-sigma regulatory factor
MHERAAQRQDRQPMADRRGQRQDRRSQGPFELFAGAASDRMRRMSSPKFELVSRAGANPGVHIIVVTGAITSSTSPAFQEAVSKVTAGALILDLTGVPSIDSMAVGSRVRLVQQGGTQGGARRRESARPERAAVDRDRAAFRHVRKRSGSRTGAALIQRLAGNRPSLVLPFAGLMNPHDRIFHRSREDAQRCPAL